MTEPMAAFMLLSTLSVIQAADVPPSISSTVVKFGDSASFYCQASDKDRFIYWYKQPLGHMIRTVAAGLYGKITASEDFKDPRFSVTKKDTQIVFTIRNIKKDDEAMYFCQNGSLVGLSFLNGTFLAVNDSEGSILITQHLQTSSIRPGGSGSLRCLMLSQSKENTVQCPGEHNVHWFRTESQKFHPGVICTHKNKSKEREKRSCMYHLSKTTQDSPDSDSYYCAVAKCGQILFGGGTEVETALVQPTDPPLLISSAVVKLGDTVTLYCAASDTETYFYWYKQTLGRMIQTVAEGFYSQVKLGEEFNNSRFNVTKNNVEYVFTIRRISREDEALYFCQSGSSFGLGFVNSTFVTVKDQQNQHKSVYVEQNLREASVQLGDPVTLQCSFHSEDAIQCPGEHNVHWFRAGSGESNPGIINTHTTRTEEKNKRKCIYGLSKTVQDSSDSGTYYCAVATNGQILFGEGTKVEISTSLELKTGLDMVPVLGVVSACCAVMVAVLILYPRKGCKEAKGQTSAAHHHGCNQTKNWNGELRAASYMALELLTTTEIWDVKQREHASVYSVAVYYTE
ncbi:uncharacterized protein LOC115427377 isoform X1 [Sphaeramia orbicularis]|uniref:Uncharacterized LOC115427377 n=1 Tax=Sphaeramia orbicularis TaxID=375764 RepID=A0A672ZNL3_9TELE|nr:uncharacterized protein LOC115427377 isoform X1 [Sphaeramia orbicularis]